MNYKLIRNAAATVLMAGMGFVAIAQDIKNSFVTVEQLMAIDNEQALRKAQEEALRVGLLDSPKVGAAAKVEEPLPQWAVKSISGAGTRVSADILVDANEHFDIHVGATISSCKVTSIADACVTLQPINKKVRTGMCPAKVCWTGNEIALELRPPQNIVGTAAGSAKPMPTPLPTAPLPSIATSVGGATPRPAPVSR